MKENYWHPFRDELDSRIDAESSLYRPHWCSTQHNGQPALALYHFNDCIAVALPYPYVDVKSDTDIMPSWLQSIPVEIDEQFKRIGKTLYRS